MKRLLRRLRRLLGLCTCPRELPGFIATDCMVHFGDGWGNCIPHEVDTGKFIAAVAVVDGVGLCASCLRAHGRRAA